MAIEEIHQAIPHRPPFLFVDAIQELSEKRIKTTKNVRPEESFFKGHYPGNPIMPGVLICESILQSGAILMSKKMNPTDQSIPVVTKLQDVRFRKIVKPGDVLETEVEIIETYRGLYFLKGKTIVSGKTAVTAKFACTMINNNI